MGGIPENTGVGCLPVRRRLSDGDRRASAGLLWISAAAHFASFLRGTFHAIGSNRLSYLRFGSHTIAGIGGDAGFDTRPYFKRLWSARGTLSSRPAGVCSPGSATS